MNIHAHVSTQSVDCDSTYSRSYIERFNEAETVEMGMAYNDFSEIHFRERVLLSVVSVYSCIQGAMSVSEDGFNWNESTDEGYRSASVYWCDDHCQDESTYRDSTAESMNY